MPNKSARFSVCLLPFFFLLTFPSQAKIYFHSDFEQGETYTQEEVKPGSKTIRLVPNHKLNEWPADRGEGVIEGNLPSKKETFQYKSRKGNHLRGVSQNKKNARVGR